jgi:GntR family transcriptional regulator / MocR family aminotransferase
MRRLLDEVLLLFPARAEGEPTGVAAGSHVFVRLPQHCREDDLVEAAHARGVQIEGAARHQANRKAAPTALIVGYGTLHQASIAPAIASLGTAYAMLAA